MSGLRMLDELCDPKRGITYGIVKVGDFIPNGIPVIRGGDIRDNRIVFNNEKRVSQEVSDQFSRTILQGGELIINLIADPGHCAITPTAMRGYNVSRDVAVIPLNTNVNHSYVNWYLKSHESVEWFRARMSGSVTQKINLSVLRQAPIPLPQRKIQDRIAAVLDALDDKIAVNERISQTAAELATSTYIAATKDIPERFKETPLSRTAEFINGRAFTKGATGSGRMVIRIAEMNSGPGNSTVYNEIEVPEKHLANPGDILFAWSGSLTAQRWNQPQGIINQHIFKVVPKDDLPAWLAFELVKYKIADFRVIAADKATTMGHIQRHHLDETVPVPDPAMISQLNSSLDPLWDRSLVAEQEKLTLAELRDTLLPQLMSGKLRVKDAEEIVEDVA